MKFLKKGEIVFLSAVVLVSMFLFDVHFFSRNVKATSYVWTNQTESPNGLWRTLSSSSDGSILIAAGGQFNINGTVYTSTDGGVNWTFRSVTHGSRKWYGSAISSDGTKMAVCSYAGDIFTSTDGGITWTDQTAAGTRNWLSITMSADGTKMAAVDNAAAPGSGVSTPGDIYTSTDGGATWTDQTAAGTRNWSSITSSADGMLLAASVSGGDIYTSTDGGATWTDQTAAGSRSWTMIASSSNGSRLVASTSGNLVYTSIDGGVNWTSHISGNIWNKVSASFDGMHLSASSNNQIYVSVDGGTTWEYESGAGIRSWGTATVSGDGSKIIGASFNSNFWVGVYDTAPNSPSALGSNNKIDGSTSNETKPTLAFLLTDPNVSDTVKYEIIISQQNNFSLPVVDYISPLSDQGSFTFTVGQPANSGTYLVGAENQTLVDGSYYWEVKTIDSAGVSSSFVAANSGGIAFVVDATAPVLTETSSVPSPTANHTPSYTFSSSENGTISYGGTCVSATTNAIVGSNTVVFNTLADSTYSSCTIIVTDALGNASSTLTITPFTVATPSTGARGHVILPENAGTTTSSTVPTPEIKKQEQNIENQKEVTVDSMENTKTLVTFTETLHQGSTHNEVFKLQSYLNTHGFTVSENGPGSLGNETESFGVLTRSALKKFQEAHALEILAPLGLTKGTGFFGQATRDFINKNQ